MEDMQFKFAWLAQALWQFGFVPFVSMYAATRGWYY